MSEQYATGRSSRSGPRGKRLRAATEFVAVLGCAMVLVACATSEKGGYLPTGSDDSGSASDASVGTFNDDAAAGDGPSGPGCDPSCVAAGGTCQSGTTCIIIENVGGLSAGVQTSLEGSGSGDPAFAWLYPYDATVFPKGLRSPVMQFAGTGAEQAYVHITCSKLDYKGFFAVYTADSMQVVLPQPSWTAVLATSSAGDPLKVSVTKMGGGAVSGPIVETWPIAQGNARGTIYYEADNGNFPGLGPMAAGLKRIAPGGATPTVLTTPTKLTGVPTLSSGCESTCHSVSADGSTLAAATQQATVQEWASASYAVGVNGLTTTDAPNDSRFTYAGLFPNGQFGMSATNYRFWDGTSPSRVYDTQTGTQVPASGWDDTIQFAGTTSFSPDGQTFAFIYEDKDQGHTLASMDFAVASTQFSNLSEVATDPSTFLGWPTFTPDSAWIIYQAAQPVSEGSEFETGPGHQADLFIVDVASHTTTRLDALDGYGAGGTYLPANDPDLNFEPTILPEAVGGYFWIVFTSHRSYGNTLSTGSSYGQLWLAAIDLNPVAGKDPSHPAFHLDGQEENANNLRGFWVLSPCGAEGASCASGDECCTGFCGSLDGGPSQCTPTAGGCSQEYESCETSADCCGSGDLCINNRCAIPLQ
jgi:hypothetical protein